MCQKRNTNEIQIFKTLAYIFSTGKSTITTKYMKDSSLRLEYWIL